MQISFSEIRSRELVDLPGSKVRVNLSASGILKLADQIIAKSKEVHDSVASVPLDKVFLNSSISLFCEMLTTRELLHALPLF